MTKPKKKATKSKVNKTIKKPSIQEAEVISEVVLEAEPQQETETISTLEVSKTNKLAQMVEMLLTPEGTDLKTLANTLGWKENSVRGAMSLYAKNHKEYQLISEKLQCIRTYRLSQVFSD